MESGRGGRGRGRGRGRGNYGGRGGEGNRDAPQQQASSRTDAENTNNNSNGSPWFGGGSGGPSYKGAGPGRGGMASSAGSSDRSGGGGVDPSGGTDGGVFRELGGIDSSKSKYGMGGLTDIIKLSNKDVSSLALGVDLLSLGLNLNNKECLYQNFRSPFASKTKSDEPSYRIPRCYNQARSSPLKPEHFGKVQVETLLYIFYSCPNDALQVQAALELYRREWRYHTEHRLWLKARSSQELMKGHPGIQFQYFDTRRWGIQLYNQMHRNSLAQGLLREEELLASLR